jgi:hypothetical protein
MGQVKRGDQLNGLSVLVSILRHSTQFKTLHFGFVTMGTTQMLKDLLVN